MSEKTKKKRQKINKKELWNKFDEINETKEKISCIYRKEGQREICECCNSLLIINDDGFHTCTNKMCGVIYKDVVDQGAEWRYYGCDDNNISDPTRAGPPINPLLHESSFGCKVICPMSATYEMRKIRRYAEWQSMPYKEKSQYDEFQRITILAGQSGIPKFIIDDAMRYHKMISETKTFRGLNRDGIIAASIYVSARINEYPRTAKEIATIFHLDNSSTTKGCKNAINIINNIEHNMDNNEKTLLCKTTPISFIERYCSKLNINNELTQVCKFIACYIQSHSLIPENTPHSIAAGIVYFISQKCHLNISKQAIYNVSEISEVTINKCYKKLDLIKIQLIPQVIINKYL